MDYGTRSSSAAIDELLGRLLHIGDIALNPVQDAESPIQEVKAGAHALEACAKAFNVEFHRI